MVGRWRAYPSTLCKLQPAHFGEHAKTRAWGGRGGWRGRRGLRSGGRRGASWGTDTGLLSPLNWNQIPDPHTPVLSLTSGVSAPLELMDWEPGVWEPRSHSSQGKETQPREGSGCLGVSWLRSRDVQPRAQWSVAGCHRATCSDEPEIQVLKLWPGAKLSSL